MSTRTAHAGIISRPMLVAATLAALAISLLWVLSPVQAEHGTPGPAVSPTETDFPGGDPNCPTGDGIRFDGAEVKNDSSGVVNIFNVDVDAGTFDFNTDAGFLVSYVFVKGGTPMNVYNYSGFPGGGVAHDDGLVTPTNPNNDTPFGISHIDFCVVETEASEAESESAEQSVAESEAESVAESEEASGEGSQKAGEGTPEGSQADSSLFFNGSGPLATIAFSLILLASLGALAYANVKSVRNIR